MIITGLNAYAGGGHMIADDKNNDQIASVTINNAVIDHLYASQNPDSDINPQWDKDTAINAFFNNNASGGNIEFLVDTVDSVQILKREHGQSEWTVVSETPIENIEDFNITYVDYYSDNKAEVEYAMVPIINGARANMVITDPVKSEFEGILIGDKDRAYRAYIYQFYNTTRNQSVTPVIPLHGRYPYMIRTAHTNYTSGALTATFVVIENNDVNYDDAKNAQFNEEVIDFLTNERPKYLKFDDGRSWIVDITSMPALQSEGALYVINFEWTQIGRTDNADDFYNNGLIELPELTD